jgi:3-methyladenine DNA glycosylase Mpg
MLNVSSEKPGIGAGVLIRVLEHGSVVFMRRWNISPYSPFSHNHLIVLQKQGE